MTALSSLMFVICFVPLTQILKKVKSGYTFHNKEKLNYFLFLDYLKIFANSKCELKRLVSTVQIFHKDSGIKFGIKKCGLLVMKREKLMSFEGGEVSNGERIKDVEGNR